MSTFPKRLPKPNSIGCCAAWHLRKSGNLLAIYDLVGKLTNNGTQPFFSSAAFVTRYFYPEVLDRPEKFQSAYEVTRKNFRMLRKIGLLEMLPDGNQNYIPHDVWAKKNPGKCVSVEKLSWHDAEFQADPLVSRLFARAGGKIKVLEHHVAGLRKLGSDDEILVLYGQEMSKAEEERLLRGWKKVNASAVLWKTRKILEARAREGRKPNMQVVS